jgi:hypothetical protein
MSKKTADSIRTGGEICHRLSEALEKFERDVAGRFEPLALCYAQTMNKQVITETSILLDTEISCDKRAHTTATVVIRNIN